MRATDFITESNIIWNTNIADMMPQNQSLAKKGVLRRVNIQELFEKTPKNYRLNIADPTGGKNKIGYRFSRSIQHWQEGGRMDPPILSIQNRQVNFLDGRHRLVAAAQLGEIEAPIIIAPADNLKQASEILKLKKW